MKRTKRLTPLALALSWAFWLTAYNPTGCTPATATRGGAAPASVSSLATPSAGLLPHPAFALASEAGGPQGVSIADIAERVTPSVVSVSSRRAARRAEEGADPFFRFFGPRGGKREQQGLGSGVIVSGDGLVLTNNHVVEDADEITAIAASGEEFKADIVGTDEKSDIAVLRLQGDVAALQPIAYGNSSALRVGDVVLAIGNPFGVGQTVTMGIVSAKGRSDTGIVDYADFIQTDAAINPGNSGGALVNMRGELVGINTAILSRTGGYQGIGFAIPSNMARPISQSLLEHGRVVRGWLGIGIQEIDRELQEALQLESDDGVLVNQVNPGSPAQKGGLEQGDVIWSVDGTKTPSVSRLRNLIAAAGANKRVVLDITRHGERRKLKLTLGELAVEEAAAEAGGSRDTQGAIEGLTLQNLDPELRERISNLPDSVKQGVVVTGVQRDSKAARDGFRPGDVIVEADRKPVGSLDDLQKHRKKGKKTALLVVRGKRSIYLTLSD